MWGALSDEGMDLSFTITVGPPQRSHSGVRIPVALATILYCLRFDTSIFVASYDSQDYDGGIRPLLHTGSELSSKLLLSYKPSARHKRKQCSSIVECMSVGFLTWSLLNQPIGTPAAD
jgi:hypothetical protein